MRYCVFESEDGCAMSGIQQCNEIDNGTRHRLHCRYNKTETVGRVKILCCQFDDVRTEMKDEIKRWSEPPPMGFASWMAPGGVFHFSKEQIFAVAENQQYILLTLIFGLSFKQWVTRSQGPGALLCWPKSFSLKTNFEKLVISDLSNLTTKYNPLLGCVFNPY